MTNSPVPVPHIQRVVAKDFPFDDAILLEECDCYDVAALRKHFKGSAVFLLARAPLELVDMTEDRSPVGNLVGFLVSDVERDECGEVHGTLKNLAVSCAEDSPDTIRAALIRRWQEECRQELWDGLRASLLPEQAVEHAAFLQESFRSLGTCPCCDAEMLQWQAKKAQSRAL